MAPDQQAALRWRSGVSRCRKGEAVKRSSSAGCRFPTRRTGTGSRLSEPIGGEMTLRTIGGSAIKQITWQKWRTTITGGGWLPFGLSSLDYSAQMAVACIAARRSVSGCPQ